MVKDWLLVSILSRLKNVMFTCTSTGGAARAWPQPPRQRRREGG
jgi:hypothetical protein